MKIPRSPMPEKEKIMKKIKKTLDKKSKEGSDIDLGNLAVELSKRKELSASEDSGNK